MDSEKSTIAGVGSFSTFLTVLALILVAMAILLYFVSLYVGVGFARLVTIIEVPASLTLSAILAYLYFRQADLMEGQQKLMGFDYTPRLSLGEVRIHDEDDKGKRSSLNRSDIKSNSGNSSSHPVEYLLIPMRNIGEGVATDLQLKLDIMSTKPDFEETRRYSALQKPLEPQDRHKYGYMSTGSMSRPIAGHYHNHLMPGDHKEFKANITFRFESNQEKTEFVFLSFSSILKLLSDQDVERARLQIDVDYSDTIQSEYDLSIVTIDFDIEDTNTLSDVLENGKMIHPTDLDEKMTGDYTPTISKVNKWISSE